MSTSSESIQLASARYDTLIRRVEAAAHQLSVARGVELDGIETRSGWSHEYDASGDVVVEVLARCPQDERFAFWDALCEAVDTLSNDVSDEERRFLTEHVSIAVRIA